MVSTGGGRGGGSSEFATVLQDVAKAGTMVRKGANVADFDRHVRRADAETAGECHVVRLDRAHSTNGPEFTRYIGWRRIEDSNDIAPRDAFRGRWFTSSHAVELVDSEC